MITRRRVLVAALIIVGALVVFGVWQTWSLYRDLDRAEQSVTELRQAIDAGDDDARKEAIADLQEAAASASDRANGVFWDVATWIPLLGDDAEGVQVLSTTLDRVATDGLDPLAESIDRLDRVSQGGRIDTRVVESLQNPVARASATFTDALVEVQELDSDGFFGTLETRYEEYADRLASAASAMASAATATEALPAMVGSEGPRDYLLIFQNNAEIRATGGIPGSWALIHAGAGKMEIRQQGSAKDFPVTEDPIVPITSAERSIYGPEIARYWQDPGFHPGFQRAAEIWRGFWDRKYPDVPIDGVIALDPVGMSYLIDGTGPVTVDGRTLTGDNLVEELLSNAYARLSPQAQDGYFQRTAKAIFDATTGDLESPVRFVEGLSRAAREGRFLVAPFEEGDAEILGDSAVLGEFPSTDDRTPYIDIGLNDATGSKMSYYLRYRADVESTSCDEGVQRFEGTLKLGQSISPEQAAALPDYVTGGGAFGTEPGDQLVAVRLYGPVGGTIENLSLDGKQLEVEEERLQDRPVATIAVSIETTDDLLVTFSMKSGEDQAGDVQLRMTPSVLPGDNDKMYATACK